MENHASGIEKILHALGDPTRRAMVEMLTERPLSVSQLAAPFKMTLTAVGQHLQILEDSGLVRTEKIGRVRTCSLAKGGFLELERWTGERKSAWERRLDRLEELLQEDD